MTAPAVIWHDVECGAYDADLALWRELAAAAGGPILDVGAGTGRVALDLARHGHEVVALDSDPDAARRAARAGARETLAVDDGRGRRARLRPRRSPVRPDHRPDADAAAARRQRRARRLPALRRRAPARPAACWRRRWPTPWRAASRAPAPRTRSPTSGEIDGIVYASHADRRPPGARRDRRSSGGARRSTARRPRHAPSTTRSARRRRGRRASSEEAAPLGLRAPPQRAVSPDDRRVRRLRGGGPRA